MASKTKDEVERDNQAPPVPENNDEWERIAVGLGEQWDFEKDGPLIGVWTGAEVVGLKEAGLDGKKEATAYLFDTDTGESVFLWQSYALTNALEKVGVGDRLKIVYKGQRDFTGERGNQRVNVFEIFKSAAQQRIAPDYGDTNPLDEV